MSGVALPRSFCSVGDLEQIKARQIAASSCSTSSASSCSSRIGARAWLKHAPGGGRRECETKVSGLGFWGHRDGDGVFGELCAHSPPKASRGRADEPVCLMPGVSGGLWEGADSENTANNQFVSRESALRKEPSLLLSLIREIQPLDVSQISKEASPDSRDAMKRTLSGMLGLLPSDQFQVTIETSHEPLAKLLVSSMMTGYTLRNAEYRVCLQRSLDLSDDDATEMGKDGEIVDREVQYGETESILETLSDYDENNVARRALELWQGESTVSTGIDIPESLGPVSDTAKGYIQYLKQKLATVSKELEECKLSNTGLQMQNIVAEEKNDLLDYLRALEPDKVAELSQPTSSEVEDVIQQVISELLDNPSLKLLHKDARLKNGMNSTIAGSWEDDGSQKFSASPLQFRSTVAVNRDYLARLLFWCMLLGHHTRGLEYRLELSRTLSLSGDLEYGLTNKKQED